MFDLEKLVRLFFLFWLLFTTAAWWRAEVHNMRLAESAMGFQQLAQTCVDTTFVRLQGLESRQREATEILLLEGPRALVEETR